MIKQLLLPLLGVAAFIIIVGVFIKSPKQKEIKIDGQVLKVAIADTPEKRAKGLAGTSSLGENEGMLFIFDSKDVNPSFWMKGMLIPLDIIWINDDKIVQIDKNIENPKPDTPDSQLKNIKANSIVDYVLEVNAGYSDKNGLEIGQSLLIP